MSVLNFRNAAVGTALLLTACSTQPVKDGDNPFVKFGKRVNNATVGAVEDGKQAIQEQSNKGKQQQLIDFGCLAEGQKDGDVGPTTRLAVKFFNDANGTSFTFETLNDTAFDKAQKLCPTAATPALARKLGG